MSLSDLADRLEREWYAHPRPSPVRRIKHRIVDPEGTCETMSHPKYAHSRDFDGVLCEDWLESE